MSPPSTRVWLFRSTTEVSASRFLKDGELVGGWFSPTELTSCLTSSATVPFSPMRGVTVRMTPASRYSTVWFTPPVVIVVLVPPPGSVPGELTALVCWLVMIGTEVETLMTAFLFSDVITCGFETMFTLFSLARALSIAMNWSVANVNAVSPAPKGPRTAAGPATPVGSVTGPAGGADVGRPRTGRPGPGSGPCVARPVDRIQRRRQVLGLGVLGVVDEHAAPPVDVDVELRDQALDRFDLVLLGVHDQRVRAALGNDQRRTLRRGAGLPGGRGRRYPWRWDRRRRRGRCSGRRRADTAAGEELGQDRRQLGGVGVRDRDDLQLLLRHLHVDEADDVEQAHDVRRRVGDDQHVRLAVGDQRTPRRDEWTQERAQIRDRRVLDRDDLRDDLVRRAGRIGRGADDRRDGALARALDAENLVEVPRLHRREAVHLEDGQQNAEYLFLRDPARGLHGDLAADVGRQHVVEADDLAGRLDDGIDVCA